MLGSGPHRAWVSIPEYGGVPVLVFQASHSVMCQQTSLYKFSRLVYDQAAKRSLSQGHGA